MKIVRAGQKKIKKGGRVKTEKRLRVYAASRTPEKSLKRVSNKPHLFWEPTTENKKRTNLPLSSV